MEIRLRGYATLIRVDDGSQCRSGVVVANPTVIALRQRRRGEEDYKCNADVDFVSHYVLSRRTTLRG